VFDGFADRRPQIGVFSDELCRASEPKSELIADHHHLGIRR
jgi:hypothetical protein